MLFIKNYTNIDNKEFKVAFKEDDNHVSLKLSSPDGTISLLESDTVGLSSSIKRSIKRINRKLGLTSDTETNLIQGVFTEIAFFLADHKLKTVIKPEMVGNSPSYKLPINAVCMGDEEFNNSDIKRLPRDMIVLLVPADDSIIKYDCMYDARNLKAPITKTSDTKLGKIKIICLTVKYPVWANLKFPAYMCVTKNNSELKTNEIIDSFKLGSASAGKVNHNSLLKCDVSTASYYLKKSREEYKKHIAERKGGKPVEQSTNNKSGKIPYNKPFVNNNNKPKPNKFSSAPKNKSTDNHRSHGRTGR